MVVARAQLDMPSHREYLERNADWRGGRPALVIVGEGEALTWREFDERANQFGNALRERGVRTGDRVLFFLHNTREFPLSIYGCYKVGAVPVPVNYMLTSADVRYILDDVNPQVVVYDAGLADIVENAAADAIRDPDLVATEETSAAADYWDIVDAASNRRPPDLPSSGGETAYILYTSGTTGNPKGVTYTRETADRRAMEMVAMMGLSQDSVALQLSPWFHAGGIDNTVHPTVTGGGTLLVQDDFDPEPALDAIETYGVTHIASVPTLTKRIADTPGAAERDLSSVECWINMGSPLSQKNAELFIETLTPNVYNNYGTTETLTDTVLRPEDLPEHAGTVGRPNIDKQVRVIDAEAGHRASPDDTVPTGKPGQVVVKGPTVFDGYYGNMEATKRAFTDGWYYTKDIGVKDTDGYLTITGRMDDMILSGGELVSPVEVEDALERHPDVRGAIVVGEPDDEWGERVKAFVAADADLSGDELAAFATEEASLASYKRPREWVFVDELERTETGKKQRFKYRDDET